MRSCWFFAASGVAFVASAQPSPQNKVRAMFEQAEAYYKIREFERALYFYKEAYLLSLEPSMLFNMAQCYRQMGRLQEAIDSYRAFLRDSKATHVLRPKAEALLKEVEAALQASPETQPASLPKTQPTSTPSSEPTPSTQKSTTTPSRPETLPALTQPTTTSLPSSMLRDGPAPPRQTSKLFYGGAALGAAALVLGGFALSSSRAARREQDEPDTDFVRVDALSSRARWLGATADLFLISSGVMAYLGYRSQSQAKE